MKPAARRRLAFSAVVAASVLVASPAHATIMGLIKRVCEGKALPQGREVAQGHPGDRSVALDPGDAVFLRTARLLPRTFPGWTADDPKVDLFASHVAGCGLRAGRTFARDGRTLAVGLLMSPLVGALKRQATEVEKAAEGLFLHEGHRVSLIKNGQETSLTLIAGDVMVLIDGSATQADKRALLERLDLEAIESFGY